MHLLKTNIPIHLYRTLVAIVDHGSITNAANVLGITQPAVSSHVRKLERLLGGPVFDRLGLGLKLTSRGNIALDYAKRSLALNDQLLDYAGPHPHPRSLSIGLPRWLRRESLVKLFQGCEQNAPGEHLRFVCDQSAVELKALVSGLLDIAFICETNNTPVPVLVEWTEPLYWVVASGFRHRADEPIPLIHWPGRLTDRYSLGFFEATSTRFIVTFSGPDANARDAAVEAGLGYMLTNWRCVTPAMQIVRELFLPPAPTIRSGIYVRRGFNIPRYASLVTALRTMLQPPQFATKKEIDVVALAQNAKRKSSSKP
jgi:DNA-binding transcriptional LysR family regulator